MKFEMPKIFERKYYVIHRVNGESKSTFYTDLDYALLNALDLCRGSNDNTQVIIEDRIFGRIVRTETLDARNIADYVRSWHAI